MAFVRLQTSLGRIFGQRCFYLFLSLLILIAVAPWFLETPNGRSILQGAQALVLIAAVAAVGRTTMPFVIAVLLATATLGFQAALLLDPGDSFHDRLYSAAFNLLFYLVAVAYLLRYVFNPDVMTDDKLFGAAAGYLMLGILFAIAYDVVQLVDPRAFGAGPGGPPKPFYDLLYMSFGILTSNGPGNLNPTGSKVRAVVILEQVTGMLFVAIVIARLAGIYPSRRERDKR